MKRFFAWLDDALAPWTINGAIQAVEAESRWRESAQAWIDFCTYSNGFGPIDRKDETVRERQAREEPIFERAFSRYVFENARADAVDAVPA